VNEETVNVAEAKKHFPELLGQVAYRKTHILITKRGKPMARLVPVEEAAEHLSNAHGWLKDDDPFFDAMERIVQDRSMHIPRILGETPAE